MLGKQDDDECKGDFASVHLRYHRDPRVMSYGSFARKSKREL